MPLATPAADQPLDPLGHLARRLVRERDREDRAGRHAVLADQVRDPVRERPRLARAGPGHDEDGPLRVQDGLGLDVVQAVEQGGADAHEPIVGGLRRPPWCGMPGESLGPGYAGCIVNAEATLPRAQTATPRPRRPLSALILKWFGIACLMVAAGLGGYVGWLLWGTGLTTQGRPERAEARLHAGHRHEGPGAGAPGRRRSRSAASAYAELADPADRPRPDRRAGHRRGVAQEGARATTPTPPTRGTRPAGSASPATAPRTCARSSAWTRCRSATRSRSGPSTGRSTTA